MPGTCETFQFQGEVSIRILPDTAAMFIWIGNRQIMILGTFDGSLEVMDQTYPEIAPGVKSPSALTS